MIWIFVVLCIIIGIIFLILLTVLFLPFSIYIWIEHVKDKINYRIAIKWPFSLFGVSIYRDKGRKEKQLLLAKKVLRQLKREKRKHKKEPETEKKEKKEEDKETKRKKKKGDKKKKTDWAKIQAFWENKGLVKEVLFPFTKFLKRIVRCIKFRLSGDVELGFSDPALVGFLYGIFWAVVSYNSSFHQLKITPNYLDTVFEGWIQIKITITLYRILFVLLLLVIALPKRRLWRLKKKLD